MLIFPLNRNKTKEEKRKFKELLKKINHLSSNEIKTVGKMRCNTLKLN